MFHLFQNMVCQGVVLEKRYILTAASCIAGGPIDKYRVRIDDWDILTNYNPYEVYKNAEFKICQSFPVTYDAGSSSCAYGGADAKLLLLEIDAGEHVMNNYSACHICLPSYEHSYQPAMIINQGTSAEPEAEGYTDINKAIKPKLRTKL